MSGVRQNGNISRLVALLGLIVLLAVAPACGGDSQPDSPISRAIEQIRSASSFHAVQTVNVQYADLLIEASGEYYYEAPDRFHLITGSEGLPFQEAIVLGSQAWTHNGRAWAPADPSDLRFVMSPIDALRAIEVPDDVQDMGAGPTYGGEQTHRYDLGPTELGANMADAAERQMQERPELEAYYADERDAWRDVLSRAELTVGDESNHLYVMTLVLDGSQIAGEIAITVDMYDEPFTIEPPI